MRLLICTQIVDAEHPILGFFHRWIEEFAKHCEMVHVICLKEGRHSLPENVHVHSLGKERGESRLKYIYRFYKYSWKLRREYNVVFVHMNQVYILLGWILWKLTGKQVGLWYMHKSVDWTLRFAEKLTDHIFTASKESFRLKSRKLQITGHGIDTARFVEQNAPSKKKYDLLTVGRITPSKNLKLLVDVLVVLRKQGEDVSLSIIGAPTKESEREYEKELKAHIAENGMTDHVHLLGGVQNELLPDYLAQTKVFVHAATNGSLDKTLLEPLAMGVPIVTSAEGAASLPLGSWHVDETPVAFAEVISKVLQSDTTVRSLKLLMYVHENHSIETLIPKILDKYGVKKTS